MEFLPIRCWNNALYMAMLLKQIALTFSAENARFTHVVDDMSNSPYSVHLMFKSG
jgi:hypothetical protein